ncbi:MAG: hypothetical protein ACTHK7_10940 [Aureliella sp.]
MARYDDDDDDEGQRVMTLDDLLGPVPETDASDSSTLQQANSDDFTLATSSAVSDKNLSKSQRVRNFLDAHPEARNRDVVEALSEYGVTAADVSNAKAQLKRKGDAPAKRGRPAASAAAPSAPASSAATSDASASASGGSIAMHEIDAALKFVREIGSLDRAKQLLVIIQQIQQL